MKRLIFTILVVMACVSSFAQQEAGTLTIQPRAGLNITNYSGPYQTTPRFGLAAGAEFEYQITKPFSMAAALMYSMQGEKVKGKAYGFTNSATLKTDYITIPIMANMYVYKGLALKLGIQPAFNVLAKYKVSVIGIGISGDLADVGIDVKTFDFAIPVGLSYEYKSFVIDARYNIGVMNIIKEDDARHNVVQIALGYKFRL